MKELATPGYDVIRSIDHRGVARLLLLDDPVFDRPRVRKLVDTLGREDGIAYLEPRLMRELQHDHVVEVFDARVAEQDGPTKIIEIDMPFYEDGSILDAFEADYRFSTRQAVELTRDVLSALTYAHEQGYLHRDVKPANVLLDRDRTYARLSDFGSAARLDEKGNARGSLGRSPLYEAPESYVGPADIRADIYAAGLCFFEMLNGPFPYGELDFETVTRRLRENRRALPDSWYVCQPWVSASLRRVVNRSIKRDRSSRYGRAADFRAALMSTRFVDWSRTCGEGLEGTWEGRFQGPRRVGTYRVQSNELRGGRIRAIAARASSTGRWMTVESRTSQLTESYEAVAAVFEASEQDAAQRFAS